jgi:hypothetical protein
MRGCCVFYEVYLTVGVAREYKIRVFCVFFDYIRAGLAQHRIVWRNGLF